MNIFISINKKCLFNKVIHCPKKYFASNIFSLMRV